MCRWLLLRLGKIGEKCMPHRDEYSDLKIKTIEWDKITPFIMVVWTVQVEHKYNNVEEEIEMIFPLCLS
jgi:hypothetical protein